MWILMLGNPVNGFRFIGPFETEEAVIKYGEFYKEVDWWITHLEEPETSGE